MNTQNIDSLIGELREKLSFRARTELTDVVAAPEVQQFLDGRAELVREERRDILQQLAALPAKYRKQAAELGAAVRKAQAREIAATTEVAEAREALGIARMRAAGVAHGELSEAGRLEQRLAATADPRLETLKDHLYELRSTVGNSCHVTEVRGRRVFGELVEAPTYTTNRPILLKAIAEIERCRDLATELQRSAVTRREVTAAIAKMLDELETVLAPLDLVILQLDAAGQIVRDRSRKARELTNAVLRAAGAQADDLSETGPEIASRKRDLFIRNQGGRA